MQSSPTATSTIHAASNSRVYVLWLAGICYAAAIVLCNPNYQWSVDRTTPYGADFLQEWAAGDMLLSGAAEKLYDRAAFHQWQHDPQRVGFTWPEAQSYPAVYPPPYYCLTAPLAYLPYRLAAIVWLGLLIAAYCAAGSLSMRCWPADHTAATNTTVNTLFWCVCLCLPAMFFGCVLGQKGSLWLLVVSGSVSLLKHQRPWAAGCVAALLTLKPTLCGLIPVAMLLSGQWRFCCGMVGGSIALYGCTALVVPTSLWSDYLQVVRGAAEYQAHSGYRPGWSTSLLSLLSPLGTPKLLNLAVLAISALCLLADCVVRAARSRLRSPMLEPQCLWRLLAGTALLSPHAYFYDLTWLLLPLSGWIASEPRRAIRNLAIVWIGMLLGQSMEFGPALPALSLVVVLVLDKARESAQVVPYERT